MGKLVVSMPVTQPTDAGGVVPQWGGRLGQLQDGIDTIRVSGPNPNSIRRAPAVSPLTKPPLSLTRGQNSNSPGRASSPWKYTMMVPRETEKSVSPKATTAVSGVAGQKRPSSPNGCGGVGFASPE